MRWFSLALLFVGACGPKDVHRDHVLRIAAVGPLAPMSPQLEGTHSMLVKGQVFDLLLTPTADGWQSRLLSQWRWVSPRELRVQLRPGLRFSDGSPLRAEDVVHSLRTDQLEVAPEGDWLRVYSSNPIEQRLLRSVIFKQVGDAYLGTGPFAVERSDPGYLRLRRVVPSPRGVSAIELTSVASPREAFARTLEGEANFLFALDVGQRELLEGVPQLRLVRAPGIHALALYLNPQRLSRDERRALVAGLSTAPIARAFAADCAPLGAHPGQPLPPGRPLQILAPSFIPGIHRTALALQRELGSRGGEIEELPLSEALERDAHNQFDLMLAYEQVWPRSASGLLWRSDSPQNHSHYSNPALDHALDDGDADGVDRALAEDPPVLVICRPGRAMAVDARLTNARIGDFDFLETLPEWEFRD